MEGIASRYALALLKIAREDKLQADYLTRLETLLAMLTNDHTLSHFLGNAFYNQESKFLLIDQVLPKTTWYDLGDFLKVLVKKRRMPFLIDILKAAMLLLEKDLKTRSGIVYSVVPLSERQMTLLQQAISDYLQIPVTLTNEVDPSMLGGIRLDVNGKVFDASILNRLSNLRQTLLTRG
jgi:F-type H+-transporting ATPase subunit delta